MYLVILVALSDRYPREARDTVLRRALYFLISVSVLLIRYFPEIARNYDQWTGDGYFVGAATSKNMLGVLCLVSGLFFIWDTLKRWSVRREGRNRAVIGVNILFTSMTLWLLDKAGSATSSLCFVLGVLIVAVAHTNIVARKPALLIKFIPFGLVLYLALQFLFGVNIVALVAEAVGRDADLTGRTQIWNVVLSVENSVLLGTGYESFWLGSRLLWVWERAGGINSAHNGYLEVYLHLGIVGLAIVVGLLASSYRAIGRSFRTDPKEASFSLAIWAILIFYNVTESALRAQFLWIVFLLSVIAVSGRGASTLRPVAIRSIRSGGHSTRRIPQRARSATGEPRIT
jgi:O-antigen ligase